MNAYVKSSMSPKRWVFHKSLHRKDNFIYIYCIHDETLTKDETVSRWAKNGRLLPHAPELDIL